MTALDFSMDHSFECAKDNSRDVAFICATGFISGQDAVEEYLACRMFPLSASQKLQGEMPILKVTLPLPEFPLAKLLGMSNDHFLVMVELGAENVLGSYIRTEHDACGLALLNGGRLNRVFEQAGVAYCPRPEPGTDVSREASKKRKEDADIWMGGGGGNG
jgi:hypothetical protein